MKLETMKMEGLSVTFRVDAYDRPLLKHEIVYNIYGINDGMKTVIDVGAHLGGTALKAASLGATVYAYEPERDSYELLRKNIEDNGFSDKIKTFQLAVGEPGPGFLYLHDINMGAHKIYRDDKRTNTQEIKIISINDVFRDNDIKHCDLLKLDCEYAEGYIIQDISEENLANVDRIAIEIHNGSERKDNSKLMIKLKKFFDITWNERRDFIFINKNLCKK